MKGRGFVFLVSDFLLQSAIFEMPQQVNCAGAWSQWLSRFGAVGCVAMLTIALSPSLPCLNSTLFCFILPLFFFFLLDSFPCQLSPPTVLLPSSPLLPSLHPFSSAPLAQCAIRWVRLHWDAEQLSQPVQLQPASGSEGQEPVFRHQ